MQLYTHERNFGARVHEYLYKGMRLVVMENELIRVSVVADKGSDIIEFLHKPSDTDFLWRSPMGLRNPALPVPVPEGVNTGDTFHDFYQGGWQDMMCAGGFRESSMMPWDYTITENTPDAVAVRFSVRSVRSPVYMEKTLELHRHCGVLVINESLTNEGDEPLEFPWGHHPAFGGEWLDPQCRIDLPGGRVVNLGGPAPRLKPGDGYTWPLVPGTGGDLVDLRHPAPPEARSHDVSAVYGLPEGWFAVTSPSRSVGFGMSWPVYVLPYVIFWQVYRGRGGYPWYGRTYNIALEPFSALKSPLHDAAQVASGVHLDPGQRLEVPMCAVAFSGVQEVERITPEGLVIPRMSA